MSPNMELSPSPPPTTKTGGVSGVGDGVSGGVGDVDDALLYGQGPSVPHPHLKSLNSSVFSSLATNRNRVFTPQLSLKLSEHVRR